MCGCFGIFLAVVSALFISSIAARRQHLDVV